MIYNPEPQKLWLSKTKQHYEFTAILTSNVTGKTSLDPICKTIFSIQVSMKNYGNSQVQSIIKTKEK